MGKTRILTCATAPLFFCFPLPSAETGSCSAFHFAGQSPSCSRLPFFPILPEALRPFFACDCACSTIEVASMMIAPLLAMIRRSAELCWDGQNIRRRHSFAMKVACLLCSNRPSMGRRNTNQVGLPLLPRLPRPSHLPCSRHPGLNKRRAEPRIAVTACTRQEGSVTSEGGFPSAPQA